MSIKRRRYLSARNRTDSTTPV